VLNREPIGIYDDFLSLGGDSLAAMGCINRIIATFGVEVALDLFLLDSANISQIAAEIARTQLSAEMAARENA
jgi:acyl carrier protein